MNTRWILTILLGVFGAPFAVHAFDSEPVQLDRFFTTAAERRELDNIRANFRPGDINIDLPGATGPSSLTINGVVLRGSGRNVAWINGKSTVAGTPGDWDINLDSANTPDGVRVPVSLTGSEQNFALQPGQTLETGTGRLHEAWQTTPLNPETAGP